jgi:multidrug efflux pump subunit AcrB
MNFATWSMHHRIPVVVLFIFLSLAGLWGFHRLPIQDMPDLDLPTLNVTLTLPGAAPLQLEADVARKAEDALATLQGLKHLNTQIVDGQVHIEVSLVIGRNLSDALNEAKDALDGIRSGLPADLDPPVVTAVRSDSDPIMTFAIASTRLDDERLSWFVDDTVSKTVLAVPGVAQFERVGGVTREVQVEVDPVRLASAGVTAVDVSRALRSMQTDASGGRGRFGLEEQSMRVLGTVTQAADLARLPIVLADGRSISLDQVALVRDGFAEPTQAALLGEKRVVGFRITAQRAWTRRASRPTSKLHLAGFTKWTQPSRCNGSPAPSTTQRSSTGARWTCSTRARCWPCWWSGGSCAIGARHWWPPPRCRCRFCRLSRPCSGSAIR